MTVVSGERLAACDADPVVPRSQDDVEPVVGRDPGQEEAHSVEEPQRPLFLPSRLREDDCPEITER